MREHYATIKDLDGKSFSKVELIEDREIRFYLTPNIYYSMYHIQDCCEDVYVEDINGDLKDLETAYILQAEERTSSEEEGHDWDESYTWTFYTLRTHKGSVDIRWYGSSNGYYSESVDIKLVVNETN